MKLGVLTLGCPKNLADMDNFMGIMKTKGHVFVKDATAADMVVIDTCGFIEEAKKESVEEIFSVLSVKKNNPKLKVVAVGCLVQRYFEEMKSDIPELDGLVGVASPATLAGLIEKGELFYRREPEGIYGYSNRISRGFSAFVKIGDGCNRNCAFCSIPLFKGTSKSRESTDIVQEVLSLLKRGIKEIVLVSQDNTQYGRDLKDGSSLESLLEKLNTLNGDFWIRVMYLHPDHLDSSLIETMLTLPKVVDYFDIPVQSGSDEILKRMGRSKNTTQLKAMFEEIRLKAPLAVLRTTIMLGYPGETEGTFQETLAFIKAVRFDRLGGFVYSSEEGTFAHSLKRTVSTRRAGSMLQSLMEEQEFISAERLSNLRGKVLKVLLEENGPNYTLARAYNSAPEVDGAVVLKGHSGEGLFVRARITNTFEHDMEGVVLDELA